MTEQKKTNFLDAIKAAQQVKSKVPAAKAKLIQQEKSMKKGPSSNRPTKRASGRGG